MKLHRVLVDRHHADLFYGMQVLLEDRLGGLVYCPIGHDWWDQGYWRFGEGFGDDRLARQFLDSSDWETDDLYQPGYGVKRWHDPHHPEREVRGVELGAVLATPHEWTHVVATVQDNQHGFHRLAQEIGAKYVYQVGNTRQQVLWELDPLALVSSEIPIEGRGVRIHQPLDESVFRFRDPAEAGDVISSFVNLTPRLETWGDNVMLHYALPEFEFRTYGIGGPDGDIQPVSAIADLMARSRFALHNKVTGDGFGHVIHQWAAIGRPLIGRGLFYRGQMAEPFWQDGVTCFDMDKHSPEWIAQAIRDLSADDYWRMCRAIRAEFEKIDYPAEAEAVREFLA